MLKCPAIAQVERDTIGQMDARFGRVARSLGIEVCGCTTLDRFFNRKFPRCGRDFARQSPTVWRKAHGNGHPVEHREDINQKETAL